MFENQPWMRDSDGLGYELAQCAEEGRDISGLKEKIDAILAMPAGSEKEKAAGDLLDATLALPIVEGYPYCEPTASKPRLPASPTFPFQATCTTACTAAGWAAAAAACWASPTRDGGAARSMPC